MLKKAIVVVIISLFIGTSIVPCISGSINENSEEQNDKNLVDFNTKFSLFPNIPRIFNCDWDFWSNRPNLIMRSDGNVGIGISEPEEKLHILDTHGLVMAHIENNKYPAGGSAVGLENIDRELWIYLDSYNMFRIFDRTTHKNPFQIEPECANNLLYLKKEKLVGINTHSPVTTLDVNGGFSTMIRTINQNTEVRNIDHTLLVDASDSPVLIELPDSDNAEGQIIIIKKTDLSQNKVKIKSIDSAKIDGSISIYLLETYHSITIQCDGTDWWVISEYKK